MIEINHDDVEQFAFSIDGREYSIPTVNKIPVGYMLRMRDIKKGDGIEMARLFVEILGKYVDGIEYMLSADDLMALAKEWANAGGVGLGE